MRRRFIFILVTCLLIQAVFLPVCSSAEGWVCIYCGYGNNGNFCSNCGHSKEDSVSPPETGLSEIAGYSGFKSLDVQYVYANSYIKNSRTPWTNSGSRTDTGEARAETTSTA